MSRRPSATGKPQILRGVSLSPGLAVGTAFRIEPQMPGFFRIRILAAEIESELDRFRQALQQSRQQYLRDKRRFEAKVGKEHAYIIDAHLMMLEDPQFISEIEKLVREKLESPERAVRRVGDRLLGVYQSLEDPFFRERAFDFEEVVQRVITNLVQLDSKGNETLPESVILVGKEIGLATLASFPLDKVKGLVLSRGGTTSHVAIVARSSRLPVVSRIENLFDAVQTGDFLFVDGTSGTVEIGRSPRKLSSFRRRLKEAASLRVTLPEDADPCYTSDGRRINLLANTEMGSEVPSALQQGAEGIGLFRTEFIHLRQRTGAMGEKEHYPAYQRLARAVADKPAIVRTLDVAVNGLETGSVHAGEEAGVLGLRGIRYSLKYPQLFRQQVRAIVRARRFGNLLIVLPMISGLDEFRRALDVIRQVEHGFAKSGSGYSPIPVGVLVEVPSMLFILDAIVKDADFLAVGTNDLIQYMLAAGRLNEDVNYLFNPLHPAILRCLVQLARAAQSNGKMALVCGEMASHPVHAALLVGCGFQHLSMNPFEIRTVKAMLRRVSYAGMSHLVETLLEMDSLQAIERKLADEAALFEEPCTQLEALNDRN